MASSRARKSDGFVLAWAIALLAMLPLPGTAWQDGLPTPAEYAERAAAAAAAAGVAFQTRSLCSHATEVRSSPALLSAAN